MFVAEQVNTSPTVETTVEICHGWNCWSVYLCSDLNIVVISSFVVITYILLPLCVTSHGSLHSSTVNLHVSQSCVQSGFDFTVVLALPKGALFVLFVLSFDVCCRLMDSLSPSAPAVCMSYDNPLWQTPLWSTLYPANFWWSVPISASSSTQHTPIYVVACKYLFMLLTLQTTVLINLLMANNTLIAVNGSYSLSYSCTYVRTCVHMYL